MTETQQLLNRAGTIALRKKAKQWNYFSTIWVMPNSRYNREYKIVCRRNNFVYVAWLPQVASTLSFRVSVKYTVGEFVKKFELHLRNGGA